MSQQSTGPTRLARLAAKEVPHRKSDRFFAAKSAARADCEQLIIDVRRSHMHEATTSELLRAAERVMRELHEITLDTPDARNIVVDLEVPRELVIERLNARREAEQRTDDSPAAVEQRLALYEEQTAPLIAHYRRQGVLAVVDGVGSPDEVFGRLLAAIVATTGLSGPGGDGRASR